MQSPVNWVDTAMVLLKSTCSRWYSWQRRRKEKMTMMMNKSFVSWCVCIDLFWRCTDRNRREEKRRRRRRRRIIHSLSRSPISVASARMIEHIERLSTDEAKELNSKKRNSVLHSLLPWDRSIDRQWLISSSSLFSRLLSLSFSLHFYIELANTYHKSTLRTRTKSLSIHKIVKLQKKLKTKKKSS